MKQNKIDQLKDILKEAAKNTTSSREKAKDFLRTINPNELVMAEQQLINEGVEPESLRSLCGAHIELMTESIKTGVSELNNDHPIKILMDEHKEILKFIDRLEELSASVDKIKEKKEFDELKDLVKHLLAAQKHHLREEKVLFPELEKRGIFGPPQIMVSEHQELHKLEIDLKQLLQNKTKLLKLFKLFQRQINKLIYLIRDHIFKENNILYPAALQVITDSQIWKQIRLACDKIGYCCFTPVHMTKNS